ncbi:MAG: DUF4922 domain-containing protein [Bacteroidales bacterium]|nr:DUF4922 domain-containing protein [Bacteroidales bacterium]
MKDPQLNDQALQLLRRQIKAWPLAAANYAALSQVETKKLSINGFEFLVQFNPSRISSSAADTDPQAIQNRKCFLCTRHLPPKQEILSWYLSKYNRAYNILCNPYPIFPLHLTITSKRHIPQQLFRRMGDMFKLAEQLSDFVIFYNGSKCGASAPDHFHFQAGNKGFLPIQFLVENGTSLEHYPVSVSVYKSEQASDMVSFFRFHHKNDSMLNLLCWKTGKMFYMVAFPRKLHRPVQFYAKGEANILLSPATIDLAGVLITPLKKDFCKLSAADVSDIFTQIS